MLRVFLYNLWNTQMKKIITCFIISLLFTAATHAQHITLPHHAQKMTFKPVKWASNGSHDTITIESYTGPRPVQIHVEETYYYEEPNGGGQMKFTGPATIVNCGKNPIVVKPNNTVICTLHADAPIMISAVSSQHASGEFQIQ